MTTTKGLQRVLRKRLVAIDRWRSVTVYKYNSPRLPYGIEGVAGMFYIVWDRPKRKNIHPFECKEVPLTDLDIVRTRNVRRLRNKAKIY